MMMMVQCLVALLVSQQSETNEAGYEGGELAAPLVGRSLATA